MPRIHSRLHDTARPLDFGRAFAIFVAVGSILLTTSGSSMHAMPPIRADLPPPITEIQRLPLLLRKLDQTHRVLYVVAHPDDEDAGLIARLVHGDGVALTLLTLTNGSGGQNEIGLELGAALGVLREQELEAAHAFDGARQLFGGMDDFGYSFSIEETLEKWGEEAVTRIVDVMRDVRPSVVLTMRPDGEGGGQHHQASARFARRAVDLAADSTWKPELGEAHEVPRLFAVRWDRGRIEHPLFLDVSTYDPLLGATYSDLGWRSRDQHKSQGMVRNRAPMAERSVRLDHLYERNGELGELESIFDDLPRPALETAPGKPTEFGKTVGPLIAQIRSKFRSSDPSAIVDDLIALAAASEAPSEAVAPWVEALRANAMRAEALAKGVRIVARADRPFIGRATASGLGTGDGPRETTMNVDLLVESQLPYTTTLLWNGFLSSATTTPGTQIQIQFAVPFADAPAMPDDRRPDVIWGDFGEIPVEFSRVDPTFPAVRLTPVQVVPEPSLRFEHREIALPIGSTFKSSARIKFHVSALEAEEVNVTLEKRDRRLEAGETDFTFAIDEPMSESSSFVAIGWKGEPPEEPVRVFVSGLAEDKNARRASDHGYQLVDYPHIRPRVVVEPAKTVVHAFACERDAGARIGYVAGTGGDMLEALRTLEYEPIELDEEQLRSRQFERFDTIVLGVRAYKVREDLKAVHPALMEWVRGGGQLIVQYNKFEMNGGDGDEESPWAPYPGFRVSRARVTDETAPVRRLVEPHRFFSHPNRITDVDFDDWVQERGHYFARTDNPQYVDLVECSDPFPFNAGPKRGGLVSAEVGAGRWTYVGLGLFRQLPAAVPGAYRLLANLVARNVP